MTFAHELYVLVSAISFSLLGFKYSDLSVSVCLCLSLSLHIYIYIYTHLEYIKIDATH